MFFNFIFNIGDILQTLNFKQIRNTIMNLSKTKSDKSNL